MKRRSFLENSVLATFGLALSPSILLSCGKPDLLPESDFSGRVMIVGAGAAGLYAGFLLQSRGIDFTILEASDRAGGRMGKRTDFADFPIDLGAQWLHGQKSLAADLVQSAGLKINRDRSDGKFWFRGAVVDSLPEKVANIMEPNASLPDVSFRNYAEQRGLGPDYQYIVEQLAGDLGADANEISIKWTAVEEDGWDSGRRDYKFEETFFDLIETEFIRKVQDHILLNTPVTRIDYSGQQVVLEDASGNSYPCDRVIVTVPITILQDGDIEFIPALPVAKTEAFGKIGMGAGMKVFLKFGEKFFDGNIAGGEVCAAYADESEGKNGNDAVLLAFAMGKQAESLSALGSDPAITNALLAELDQMYAGRASATFLDSHVEDWSAHPYIRGAYSFSKVGIGQARSEAAEPVGKVLYFAGEAMNISGHHQTVQGALETGRREVIRILESVQD